MWYFAYGSNMDSLRMAERIGRSIRGRRARLEGWSLTFDKASSTPGEGFANIQRKPGLLVWGVLYEVTPEELAILDRYEGVAKKQYRREQITVRCEDYGDIEAVTYVAMRCAPGLKPDVNYLDHIVRGAREHGLPSEYVDQLSTVAPVK